MELDKDATRCLKSRNVTEHKLICLVKVFYVERSDMIFF